ncbi:hypothetical protein ACP26F_19660 [Franconibacter pulveris 1160]|jgi:hypothetical protein|uniref:Uncharacterized protein n=1 Tax=Franconibacter daqui TaxID=2047724 RepID=A0ABV1PJX3_9ENTR|nr:hypothetical protein [Franconibacter pulveris]
MNNKISLPHSPQASSPAGASADCKKTDFQHSSLSPEVKKKIQDEVLNDYFAQLDALKKEIEGYKAGLSLSEKEIFDKEMVLFIARHKG